MAAWRVVVGILIFFSLGCGMPPGTPGTPSQADKYRVAPPDVLLISVRPAPEISREVVVRPDGRISFDLIGEVDVEGKTIEEIQREITARVEQFIVHPDVTVILGSSNSRVYYVFGEVRSPGAYPLIGHVTALQALGTARGGGNFADLSDARLVRPTEGKGLRYPVNFVEIAQEGDASTNYELQPGDVIYVPPRSSAVIGYALGVILFPIQQIIGLGGGIARLP
jgi:polysaccharide export outer membrane protein